MSASTSQTLPNLLISPRAAMMFPNYQNGYPHGSLKAGLEHLQGLSNTLRPTSMRELMVKLRRSYEKLQLVEEKITATRNSLTRSDEVEGDKSDTLRTARKDNQFEIYLLELHLWDLIRTRDRDLETEEIDNRLAAALEECTTFRLYARMGDYLAILQQEIKLHPVLFDFNFKQFGFVSEIVDAIDKEIKERTDKEMKEKANKEIKERTDKELQEESTSQVLQEESSDDKPKNSPTSVLEALQKVAKFMESPYKNTEEVVEVFRAYAERNKMFHSGAKAVYDQGNFIRLRQTIIADRQSLEHYSFPADQKAIFLRTLQIVVDSFYLTFSWNVEGMYDLNSRARILFRHGDYVDIDGKPFYPPLKPPTPLTPQEARLAKKAQISMEENLATYMQDVETARINGNFSMILQSLDDLCRNPEDISKKINEIVKMVKVSQENTEKLKQENSDIKRHAKEQQTEQQKKNKSLTKSLEAAEETVVWQRSTLKKMERRLYSTEEGSGDLNDVFPGFGDEDEDEDSTGSVVINRKEDVDKTGNIAGN